MRFLANLGFLFPGRSLPDRIAAAAAAGFDGVEFHDDVQRHDAGAIAAALGGLAVGSLNLAMGETFGAAALPGLEARFLADLRAAEAAAQAVGARALHVVAGRGPADDAIYRANLRRALDETDRLLLIEPLCAAAVPGYHLAHLDQALEVVDAIGSPRLRVMFDWFHIATDLGPDAAAQALSRHRDRIGHVQLAAAPGRAEPAPALLAPIIDAGIETVGLEYRPTVPEAETLAALRQALTCP
jgi:hydroxypyruvate isomerase